MYVDTVKEKITPMAKSLTEESKDVDRSEDTGKFITSTYVAIVDEWPLLHVVVDECFNVVVAIYCVEPQND